MASKLYSTNSDDENKQEENSEQDDENGSRHLFRSMSMETGLKAIKISSSSTTIHSKPKTKAIEPKKNRKVIIVVPGGWARDKLLKLSYYHPVQPSHETFPKTQLEEMLTRLTECFRALSCHVSYAKDRLGADCLTMEKVAFYVSFFEKDTQTVIVEVQRRAGDSYLFHHDYAQPILAVIRGVRASDKQQSIQRRTAAFLDRLGTSISEEDIGEALEMAFRLVTSDRFDARQLGMESLVALTDTKVTGWSTASAVTRGLVTPLDETSEKLANIVLRYLLEDDNAITDLTYMALKVWSNAWQVAAVDTETPLESFCDVMCPADILMRSLMNRVEHFENQPHEATLALRGLSALCREMPQLRPFVSWHTVEQANAMGSTAALEQASRTFLEVR